MQTDDESLDKLPHDSKLAYHAGHVLLSALADLEEDIKYNYESGTVQQQALARVAGLQGDLFSSYLILLWQGPIIGRSIILRSLIEHEGTLLHIKGSDKKSAKYLSYSDKIHNRVKNRVGGEKPDEGDYRWTDSTIGQRIALFPDENVQNVYDMLSDATHGNNLQDFLNTEEVTKAYIKAIDSYFVAVFIDFMSELGIGLAMNDEKRKAVFKAIKSAGNIKSS